MSTVLSEQIDCGLVHVGFCSSQHNRISGAIVFEHLCGLAERAHRRSDSSASEDVPPTKRLKREPSLEDSQDLDSTIVCDGEISSVRCVQDEPRLYHQGHCPFSLLSTVVMVHMCTSDLAVQ